MTIRAYKTFIAGPVNFTVSRSGLSTSVGGKFIRAGTKPGRRGALRYSVKVPGTSWRLRRG
jgi:hypothetical protein